MVGRAEWAGCAELDRLAEVLTETPPAFDAWTDEVHDQYEKWSQGAGFRLTEEERSLFEGARTRERLSSEAYELLGSLKRRVGEGASGSPEAAKAARLAERCVREGLAAGEAFGLLYALGVPVGERMLLGLVCDESLSANDRIRVREWLTALHRPGYAVRAAEPVLESEEALLPASAWAVEYARSPEGFSLQGSGENLALAESLLRDLLPPRRLEFPEPLPDWEGDWDEDELARPDWLEIRMVVLSFMPHPWLVTRERMTEAQRECESLGLEVDGEDFVERWTVRLSAFLVEDVFRWLSAKSPRVEGVTPWLAGLVESYVQRGCAAGEAMRTLAVLDFEPGNAAALGRIAHDDSLPPDVREWAAGAL